MHNYLQLLRQCLNFGIDKDDRTNTGTISIGNARFEHSMSRGFPAVTTKKLAFKTMAVELEGFIGGITDKRWYQERGCKIWDEWCNPKSLLKSLPLSKQIKPELQDDFIKMMQKQNNDLGPIYGWQWRRFNQYYTPSEPNSQKLEPADAQFDQLYQCIKQLKENRNSRRLVVSAWNPCQIDQMALPPCHFSFTLYQNNGKLSLEWHQRSADALLGVPFNIASYGLLLVLISMECNLVPDKLVGNFTDFHIYKNHIEQAKTQVFRQPFALPTLEISDFTSIFSWSSDQAKLVQYLHHPPIKADVAV